MYICTLGKLQVSEVPQVAYFTHRTQRQLHSHTNTAESSQHQTSNSAKQTLRHTRPYVAGE